MKKNAHFTAVFGFHLYFPLCLAFVWDSRPVPEVNILFKTRHNYYPFLVEIYAVEEFTAYEHTWYRICKKFCHQTLGSSPWTCCYLLQFSPDSLMGGELLCDHHPSYHLCSQPQKKKKRINSQHNSQNVTTYKSVSVLDEPEFEKHQFRQVVHQTKATVFLMLYSVEYERNMIYHDFIQIQSLH